MRAAVRYLSLFSGIEAATQAWAPLGWTCAGVSEIDPFACALLAQRHPHVPNLGDITRITEADIAALGLVDLVVFGSPCQDLSVAGKRKGLYGARSGLFFTAMRIVGWLRKHCGLRFALWENVPGAFSSNKGLDFAAVVDALAGLEPGTTVTPPSGWGTEGCAAGEEALVEWSTLDAQWFGVAQRRRRVFALADFGDWSNRPPILLERESLRGDTAPRRKTGQEVAPTIRAGAPVGGAGHGTRSGDSKDELIVAVPQQRSVLSVALRGREGGATAELGDECMGTLRASGGGGDKPHVLICTDEISHCLNAGGMGRIDYETETLIVAFHSNAQPDEMRFDPHLSAALTCSQNSAVCITGSVTHTLKADVFDASEDGTGHGTPIVPVAIRTAQTSANGSGISPELAHTLDRVQGQAVAYSTKLHNTASNQAVGVTIHGTHPTVQKIASYDEVAQCLRARTPGNMDNSSTSVVMQVRRLTVEECEFLQGFPRSYTAIPWRGKPAELCPDGPRYKALGLSMAVPVMRWIGQEIDFVWRWF